MQKTAHRVCPVQRAGSLDNRIRKWFQNPRKILGPYIREGMVVLDVGCGPGFFSIEMAGMVGGSGRVIACDLQVGMLLKLRKKIDGTALQERIVLHQCEENRIGVTEDVDFVLAFYVVHEIPNPRAFFEEIRSILRPAGRLLVVEPHFHVSKKKFKTTIEIARDVGFATIDTSGILLSKTALFKSVGLPF